MITPADIENKEFSRGVRGYKEEEVDEFLDLIILDMEKLLRENKQLKKELEKAQGQMELHVSTEGSVYETLEAAKSLMNDIAASAERRAEVLVKDAELEAALITREAKESVVRLTEEGNRLRRSMERIREKYRQILEMELERADLMGNDLFAELEGDFFPKAGKLTTENAPAAKQEEKVPSQEKKENTEADLSKTVVNIR